jgi:hypothetical protein
MAVDSVAKSGREPTILNLFSGNSNPEKIVPI